MSDTSGRLLRLLSLLQARPEWTGPELAERLGVSGRTIRSDVARLRDLGYPVDAAPGVTGGYRMRAGTSMPPLLLDDDEAVAVAVGLRTAACTALAGIEETSLRALTKLDQILPDRLRRRIGALQTEVEPLRWGRADAVVDPEALAVLSQACRDREQVRFDYEDRQGAESRRLVEPYRLVADGHRWYLLAWDVRRDDWRTFRVDRTVRPRLAGVRFALRPLPAADAATFVRDSITGRPARHHATVTLHLSLDEARRLVPAAAGSLEAIDASRCRFRTSADDLDWLAFRLGMLGCDFVVEEPAELVDRLRTAGRRITTAARASRAAATTASAGSRGEAG